MFTSSWLHLPFFFMGILHIGDSIYSGQLATIEQFPYLAFVLHRSGRQLLKCGGATLDTTHILTAAHCVNTEDVRNVTVVVGQTTFVRLADLNRRKVKKIVLADFTEDRMLSNLEVLVNTVFCMWRSSPKFVAGENDLAVITLEEPLSLGPSISTIALPDRDISTANYNQKCQFAGWGLTNNNTIEKPPVNLYSTELVILSPQECGRLDSQFHASEFCAIDPKRISMAMPGDSGGPLVLDGVVVGIASKGPCDIQTPDIYTKVFSHVDFIRRAMRACISV